jgi:hypothetical protein
MRNALTKFIYSLLVVSLCSGISLAIPRYSMRYNQSCSQCHINPNGHGARNLFGAQFFAYNELAMTKPENPAAMNPMISDQIQIGLDSRIQYYGELYKKGTPGSNSFMQMQGELYLIYNFSSSWQFYLDKGLGGGPSGQGGFQVFGLGRILPLNGYVKAGHFTPPYGMHLADHKAFVLSQLGLGGSFGSYWEETGVEVGIQPGSFLLSVAATNGSAAFTDADEGKAVTGHADFRHSFSDLHLWYGVSGRFNKVSLQEDRLGGVYGGIMYKKFGLLGEADYRSNKTGTQEVKSMASFLELSWLLRPGVTLRLEQDYYDPDLDLKSGSENMYVLGAEIVPTGFLQVIPNARFHDRDPGSSLDYYEFEVQLHLFY